MMYGMTTSLVDVMSSCRAVCCHRWSRTLLVCPVTTGAPSTKPVEQEVSDLGIRDYRGVDVHLLKRSHARIDELVLEVVRCRRSLRGPGISDFLARLKIEKDESVQLPVFATPPAHRAWLTNQVQFDECFVSNEL